MDRELREGDDPSVFVAGVDAHAGHESAQLIISGRARTGEVSQDREIERGRARFVKFNGQVVEFGWPDQRLELCGQFVLEHAGDLRGHERLMLVVDAEHEPNAEVGRENLWPLIDKCGSLIDDPCAAQ